MTNAEKLRSLSKILEETTFYSGRGLGKNLDIDLDRIADLLEKHGAAIEALESGEWQLVPKKEFIALQRVMPLPPNVVTFNQGNLIIDAAQDLCVAVLAAAPKPGEKD